MAMELWRPMRELRRLSDEMERLFDETFSPFEGRGMEMGPVRMFPVNVQQKGNDLVVEASLPGVNPEDVDVSVAGRTLTIKAERKETKETKEEDYYWREMRAGRFFRQFTLPTEVQADKADATFENGVLKLRMPVVQASREVPIKLKAGGSEQKAMEGGGTPARGT